MWAAAMKTGPNDVSRCVVWAIGMFILFYFVLTMFFLLYLGMRMVQVGGDSKKGPKRRVKTRHLGNKYVFFYLFLCSCILTIFDYYI